MKLYWSPKTRSVRILWLMEETGLPYERVLVDMKAPTRSDPAFREISPMGKLPAFVDGSTQLWDSGAICAYVADQYPETKLAPKIGDPDRGRYLQWLMFTNSVMEPAMGEKFAKMPPAPTTYGWGSWDQMIQTLRHGVEKGGPWILGDRFTAADVLVGSGTRYMRVFGMLGDDPVLSAYADRCVARPAYVRALAMEAEEAA
jgi:glutathione S-transferase